MSPRVDTVVRGGKIVTASDIFEAAVAIKGDKIAAIGPEDLLPPADRMIDAGGRFVLPGLIDCHLHVGAEYDDWKTAPLAAAQTGLTTLLPFVVYDDGESLPTAVARLREEAQSLSVLDFGFHFILNHEPRILEGLADAFRDAITSTRPVEKKTVANRVPRTPWSPPPGVPKAKLKRKMYHHGIGLRDGEQLTNQEIEQSQPRHQP